MKRQELLNNAGYWTSKIQFELYDELLKYIEKNNLNRTQLAKKLGFSKGYISQVLNGDYNHKVSKMVELSMAIGKIPKVEFIDVNEFIKEESNGTKSVSWKIIPSNIESTELSRATSNRSKEGNVVSLNESCYSLISDGNS